MLGAPGSGKTALAARSGYDYAARTHAELDNFAAMAARAGRPVLSLPGLAKSCPAGLPANPLGAARTCRERRRAGCPFYERAVELAPRLGRALARHSIGPSALEELARRLGVCPFYAARLAAGRARRLAVTHHMLFSLLWMFGDRTVFIDEAHAVFDAFTRVAWSAVRWDEVPGYALPREGGAAKLLAEAVRRGDLDAVRELAPRLRGPLAKLASEGTVGGGYLYLPRGEFRLPPSYVLATSTPPPRPVWRRLVDGVEEVGGGVTGRLDVVLDGTLDSRARGRGEELYRLYAGKVAWIAARHRRVLVVAVSRAFAAAVRAVAGRLGNVDWTWFRSSVAEGVNVDYDAVVLAGYPEPPPGAYETPTAELMYRLGAGREEYGRWLVEVAVVQAMGRAGRFRRGRVYALDRRYRGLLGGLRIGFEELEVPATETRGGGVWRAFLAP